MTGRSHPLSAAILEILRVGLALRALFHPASLCSFEKFPGSCQLLATYACLNKTLSPQRRLSPPQVVFRPCTLPARLLVRSQASSSVHKGRRRGMYQPVCARGRLLPQTKPQARQQSGIICLKPRQPQPNVYSCSAQTHLAGLQHAEKPLCSNETPCSRQAADPFEMLNAHPHATSDTHLCVISHACWLL